METDIRQLTNKKTFKITNSFNLADINLNILSLDLFFLLVTQISKEDTEIYEYHTSLSTLKKKLNKNYLNKESVIKSVNELLKTPVQFNYKANDDSEQISSYPLFSKFTYQEGQIEFRLNPDLYDLIQLNNRFTTGNLDEFISLKGFYPKRLYLLCQQWKSTNRFSINIEHFRKILNIGNKYEKFGMFKERIINNSIKEINELTSLDVTMLEPSKNGKKIDKINFLINKEVKPKKKKDTAFDNLAAWVNQDDDDAEVIDVTIIDDGISIPSF